MPTELPEYFEITPQQLEEMRNTIETPGIPCITKQDILVKLWAEVNSHGPKNQGARIRALELICKIEGYFAQDGDEDGEPVETDEEMTRELVGEVMKEFVNSY